MADLPFASIRAQATTPAIVFGGRAVVQLSMLGTILMVGRNLGAVELGNYVTGLGLGSVFVGGATSGCPVMTLRRASRRELSRSWSGWMVRRQIVLGCAGTMGAAAAGSVVLGGLAGAAVGTSGAFVAFGNSMANTGQNIHVAQNRPLRSACTDGIAGVLAIGLVVGGTTLGVGAAEALGLVGVAFAASAMYSYTGVHFGADPLATPPTWTELAQFTSVGITYATYGRIDTVFVAAMMGPETAGVYGAAYRLLGVFSLIGSAFVPVYLSRLSRHSEDPEEWARTVRWGRLSLFVLTALTALALVVVARPAIRLLFGSDFGGAGATAQVLLLSTLAWAVWWPRSSEFAAAGTPGWVAPAMVTGVCVNLLVLVIAARGTGSATSAGVAWVLSECSVAIALILISRLVRWPHAHPLSRRATESDRN